MIFVPKDKYNILYRKYPPQQFLITSVPTICVFTCLEIAIKFCLSFLYRYTLRATINHKADHFTANIIDSSSRLFVYNDLDGVEEVDQSFLPVETAVYISES